MSKLVQKVKWDLGRPHAEITEMYMYDEADFESNNAMQEPLKKLYEYENQYDTVKEYIKELKLEIETRFVKGAFCRIFGIRLVRRIYLAI